jgi:hypothetical protein
VCRRRCAADEGYQQTRSGSKFTINTQAFEHELEDDVGVSSTKVYVNVEETIHRV